MYDQIQKIHSLPWSNELFGRIIIRRTSFARRISHFFDAPLFHLVEQRATLRRTSTARIHYRVTARRTSTACLLLSSISGIGNSLIRLSAMDPMSLLLEDEDSEEEMWEEMMERARTGATAAASAATAVVVAAANRDHRTLPRSSRKDYDHVGAAANIQRDYLGPHPLFDDRQFETMFRISKSRFQRFMEDIGASENPFYLNRMNPNGTEGASFEARLLLPLKSLAYGVPPHTFRDYFSMSEQMARDCCHQFDLVVKKLYTEEYLRLPTRTDLKAISTLHAAAHGVEGMLGSLDCMHVSWKNCPVAWQGSFKGKEKKPTIVLEALCDYNRWFWHASFGYAGTLNDKTILDLSPLLQALVDGTFIDKEQDVVPFVIFGEEFSKMFILVDGIYPQFSRFVKGYKEPAGPMESRYIDWQEAVRKAIE